LATIRASERLAFVWRAQSIQAAKEDDKSSIFFVEFRGVWGFWHEHAGRCRNENIILHEAFLRNESLNGRDEPVFGPDQKPVYAENEKYVGKDDEYIQIMEGCLPSEVGYFRFARDAKGNRIPLTKKVYPPAPLRLAVLRQDERYLERTISDVNVSGAIKVEKPLQRLPGEPRPDLERLRKLAQLPAPERRAAIGASDKPFPHDANGRAIASAGHLPQGDDRADQTTAQTPRPSYARPTQRLDGQDRKAGMPPGGFSVVK
jgi:hypothetical protein